MKKYTEIEIRYAINQALGSVSPLTVMIRLMRSGRIWVQDRIISYLKENSVILN